MGKNYEAVIGLEIHAQMETRSKMFCACPVVDLTLAPPNTAVCPVCSGMPGVLPVVNQKAVEYALRVALALDCQIAHTSIFARKNYFYPDLPKGYQISQYEQPLAVDGCLLIRTATGEREIRIRRVHLEEDTGKIVHIKSDQVSDSDTQENDLPSQHDGSYSLVDLNRSGVPLLEIVTEPDLHTPEEVRAYAMGLRSLLRYLEVNSGDMQKGVLRIEPNVSVRPAGSESLGTRTEVKNLNSFRALERAVAYEIDRQIEVLRNGGSVVQQTVGWDDDQQITVPQRGKEEAHDYRYFPEPDLPPLVVDDAWIERIRSTLPELPMQRFHRFLNQYGLSEYEADVLVAEKSVADYFERVVEAAPDVPPKTIINWVTGELFGLMNQTGTAIDDVKISPEALGSIVRMVARGEINQTTGKEVLAEIFETGKSPERIVEDRGLKQISDGEIIAELVERSLAENPEQLQSYLRGKKTISNWFFGQVMRLARGRANPQVVRKELEKRLNTLSERE